jgi:hypothetical protein
VLIDPTSTWKFVTYGGLQRSLDLLWNLMESLPERKYPPEIQEREPNGSAIPHNQSFGGSRPI